MICWNPLQENRMKLLSTTVTAGSVPKRKTAETLSFIINIVESASMQFQALNLSCVPFACRRKGWPMMVSRQVRDAAAITVKGNRNDFGAPEGMAR
jgi:hypothetical protein